MSTGKPRFVPTRDWRRVSILLFAALCLHTPPARAQLSSSCLGSDPSNNSSCYAGRSNTELELLIRGTPTIPFDPPEVCGVVVTTPGIARSVLTGDACLRLRREALTLTFNIRRSVIFGDGLFGQDRVSCYEDAPPFSIVLRCGDVFVPNPNTADPNDALTVGQQTPVSDLLSGSLALCDLAGCPALATDPCGATIGRLAMIMHEVNDSRRQDGNCPLCPGDLIPPALACPAGPLVFECEQPAGATINYTVTVADNCDPLPSLVCFPPPGTLLPLGPRTVQCDAQDLRGNLTTCTFDVQIVDTTPPAIQCPAERIVVDCVPGLQNGAIVNFPPPVATDICDLSPTVTCTPPSGSFFLFGLTTVTCTATDDSGNQSFCSVLIEVVEQTPVQLFCSGDVTVECTSSGGMVVSYPAPMISDTCDPPPAPICTPPSGSLFPLGTTAVTCATQTADGLPLSCQFNVNVVDTQAPTIVCPLDITVECAAPSGTRVLFDVPATDACDASPAVTCVPPSGTIFPPGLTPVLCTATDASGNQAQCTFSVLVRDTTPPRLTCPQGPITVGCDVQGTPPSAVVNYASPAVTDNCDPAAAVTCTPPSGSFFPLGITTVTCTATDASLNQSVCTFDVHVVDSAPPSLVCIQDITRECDGPTGATVSYPQPVASDACFGAPVVTCTRPSGSLFPIGITPVTCTATDPGGNVSTCSFNVAVRDTTPPVLLCPVDIVVECSSPLGTPVSFNVQAIDTCDPAPTIACTPPSGSLFSPGPTLVTCTATDRFGNSSSCTFAVSVVDTVPPLMTCPASVTAECASPLGAPVVFTVGATDACEGSAAVTCTPPSGSVFPPGTTIVSCSAIDSAGNVSQCQFQVHVLDTTPPSITCSQPALVVECDQAAGGTVQYPLPAVSDACDPLPRVTCVPPPNSILPLGLHTVSCTATDSSGNEASCSFTVRVVDTAPPSLVCVGDVIRECVIPEGAFVDYPLPVATDVCRVAPNLSCLPPSGSLFPVGTTPVTCTADDANGNMISCTFNVTVRDTTPPLLPCPADVVIPCTSPLGTPVSFTVAASDACDPTPIVSCAPPSGSLFPLGITVVTCTARDISGNVSSCTFAVNVVDQTPPSIVCPASFERECTLDGMATVTYPAPSVTDGCDLAPTVVCAPPSGSLLPPGAHVISCTATDRSGNLSSCEFTVTVVDTAVPALVCPPDMTVECDGPDGAFVDYPPPVANDACDGQPPVSCTPPPGSLFALGSTEVVCTSSDSAGNRIQCTFVVTVVDTTPPTITCPEPLVVECDSEIGTTVVFEALVTDLCDPSPLLTCTPPSGSLLPLGQSQVTCQAVDAAGNRTSCSFSVTVVDRTPPTIQCPGDLVVTCEVTAETPRYSPGGSLPSAACSTVVSFADPDVNDGCQATTPQVVSSPPSGSRLELGAHTVTSRVLDAAGNEVSCTFNITVVLDRKGFIRADANADNRLNIADAIFTVHFLFLGGVEPTCDDANDSNDDGRLNIADAIFSLAYFFQGGDVPPAPFLPLCGYDLSVDGLGCDSYAPCE